MSDEAVQPGERVLTSGGDQIFPKGLPVGTVTRVSPGQDLFLNIRVKPAANLSRLEEVLVITQQQEKGPAVAEGERVRAADILAQRLPSVPDKPAANPSQPALAGRIEHFATGCIACQAGIGRNRGRQTKWRSYRDRGADRDHKPEAAGRGRRSRRSSPSATLSRLSPAEAPLW